MSGIGPACRAHAWKEVGTSARPSMWSGFGCKRALFAHPTSLRIARAIGYKNATMKIITPEVIEGLMSRAAVAARKRTNLNLHEDYSDPINRFLNVGLSGTYVRPHRHRIGKWEIACLLQG